MEKEPFAMLSAGRRIACVLLAVLALAFLAAPAAAREGPFRGLSLTEALQRLQAQGLPVFFSSGVVRSSMRVETEPKGGSPREILDEILRPHGLCAEELAGRLVVVAAPPPPPETGRPTAAEPESAPMTVVRDEIDVYQDAATPDLEEIHGTHSIDAADRASWPHLGNDPFRAVGLLPGMAGSETSSQTHVRGGRDDEVLVVLDGLELLAPYHLQEFDSALSIVAPSFLGRVELSTGGYPAEYGDRMGGVLDMTTLTPPRSRRFELGLGLLYGDASASAALPGDLGRWYGAARGGNYHLALEVNGRDEKPSYWDTFGKLELSPRPGQTLQLNVLAAEDDFGLDAEDEFGLEGSGAGGEHYRSQWGNRYLWLTHGALVRPDLFVETIASAGRIDRDRAGSAEGEDGLAVRDSRVLDFNGLKQVWRAQPGERLSFEAGAELRWLRSNIDYQSDPREFQGTLDYTQAGAFVSTRLQPWAALTADLGARYDHNGATGEDHLSPRLNLAWKPRDNDIFRFAWGWFYQSQRPNELQVEDGETGLAPDEWAEHLSLGYEHRRESGALLRVEAYRRRLSRLRVRHENLYDPIVLFPELSADRVRIAPDGGLSSGIEVLLRGAERGPLTWWLTYTFSSVEEDIAGRKVPRAVDQPHALRADLNYRTESGWSFNAAWLYHTGWPTTSVTGRAVTAADGSIRIEPVFGPYNGERLSPYHRLDARVSHGWKLPLGQLDAYVDLQNLYDRQNVRGFDRFTFEPGPGGDIRVRSEEVGWGEFLPSFGVRWQF
ncbi:MAG TPA: TonB-dependent receptor [Thermoanaerobaculia bacterium]|nr:TonB-dependent receptor [Thermoanaerobaculia bacterium]